MKNKHLETGLKKIKAKQDKQKVFETSQFESLEVTELKKAGFLKEIIRGWVYLSSPNEKEFETTSWYINYWEFISRYLTKRFRNNYCLNAESSLLIHCNERYIPKQISVILKNGTTSNVELPFGTSILTYPDSKNFPIRSNIVKLRELSIMSCEYALCKAGPSFWRDRQKEVEILLNAKVDFQKLINVLTESKTSMNTAASRFYGAFMFIEKTEDAKMLKTLYDATYGGSLALNNPFDENAVRFLRSNKPKSVTSLKLEAMWNAWRDSVSEIGASLVKKEFSSADIELMLEDIQQEDMYHSLSIEGYKITDELVDKVVNGKWNPLDDSDDKKTRDALAAKGYFDAFNEIKENLKEIINGEKKEKDIENFHKQWFLKLFGPSVQLGIIKAGDLAGYRKHQVFIRNSQHVPLDESELMDAMQTYFELLSNEDDIFVKAVLGHHFFGYIHPYMDGNGRVARFIMNFYLVLGGIKWSVIKVEKREEYMNALETASVQKDIKPFAMFVKNAIK